MKVKVNKKDFEFSELLPALFSLKNPSRFLSDCQIFRFRNYCERQSFQPTRSVTVKKLSDEIINVEDLQRDVKKVFTTIQTR